MDKKDMLTEYFLATNEPYDVISRGDLNFKKTSLNLDSFDKKNILPGTKLKRLTRGRSSVLDMQAGDIVTLDFIGTKRNDDGCVYLKECSEKNFHGEWNSHLFDIDTDLVIKESKGFEEDNIFIKKLFVIVDSKENVIFSKGVKDYKSIFGESSKIVELRKYVIRLKKELIKKNIYKQYEFSKFCGIVESELNIAYNNLVHI